MKMTGRNEKELEGVSLLGNQTNVYRADYAPEVLETFPNKHPENDYFVKFNCPEFTSLCPKTGQPDFATIYISYVPGERMVESKSLKLYLFSFRNHGDFHEDCVNIIMKDLIPNTVGIIVIQVMFTIPSAIFTEAFLSFIGIGLAEPQASLGVLINGGYQVLQNYPHVLICPAIVIVLIMVCFSILGDGLRDALDPQMRK